MGEEMNKISISVIVPCYNAEAFVEECVKGISISCPYEVILINDGSIDKTETICEDLQRRYPIVTFISQRNKGVCAARYEGWKNAKGDFVTFLDVDDRLTLSDDVIKLLNNNYDVIKAGGFYVDDNRNDKYSNVFLGEINDKETALSLMLDVKMMPFIHSAVYRREIIDSSCFDISPRFKIGEDLLFSMKLFGKEGVRIVSIDTPIYYYVQQSASVMHTKIWGFNYIRDFNTQLMAIVDASAPSLHRKAVEHRFFDYIGTMEFPEVTIKDNYCLEIETLINTEPWLMTKLPAHKRFIVSHQFLYRIYIALIHIFKKMRRKDMRQIVD